MGWGGGYCSWNEQANNHVPFPLKNECHAVPPLNAELPLRLPTRSQRWSNHWRRIRRTIPLAEQIGPDTNIGLCLLSPPRPAPGPQSWEEGPAVDEQTSGPRFLRCGVRHRGYAVRLVRGSLGRRGCCRFFSRCVSCRCTRPTENASFLTYLAQHKQRHYGLVSSCPTLGSTILFAPAGPGWEVPRRVGVHDVIHYNVVVALRKRGLWFIAIFSPKKTCQFSMHCRFCALLF